MAGASTLVLAAAALLASATGAQAALTTYQTYSGNVGVSTDGVGSVNATVNPTSVAAFIPVGSTILSATLYADTFQSSTGTVPTVQLNGNTVAFPYFYQNPSDGFLGVYRADVTSIVAPLVGGGSAAPINIPVILGSPNVSDGVALVVAYSNPSLPVSSIGILDGGAETTGATTVVNFAQPLDPTAAGFSAELRIGDGYSYDGSQDATSGNQVSTIKVDGTTITNNAGNADSGVDGNGAETNGNLITVGANNDPFSPLLPTVAQDHERYNIAPEITAGDTSITINTINASQDDNIFLAVLDVSGIAGFNAPPPVTTPPGPTSVPEPASFAMLAAGLFGVGFMRRRRS